jgi:hypothetical protein
MSAPVLENEDVDVFESTEQLRGVRERLEQLCEYRDGLIALARSMGVPWISILDRAKISRSTALLIVNRTKPLEVEGPVDQLRVLADLRGACEEIASLEAERDRFIVAYRVDGYSFEDIARALGMTRQGVTLAAKRLNGGVLPVPRQRS